MVFFIPGVEGAFKKLKPDPCASSPHIGHTPTTASCPTPARRRHRTTFTQVCREMLHYFVNIRYTFIDSGDNNIAVAAVIMDTERQKITGW